MHYGWVDALLFVWEPKIVCCVWLITFVFSFYEFQDFLSFIFQSEVTALWLDSINWKRGRGEICAGADLVHEQNRSRGIERQSLMPEPKKAISFCTFCDSSSAVVTETQPNHVSGWRAWQSWGVCAVNYSFQNQNSLLLVKQMKRFFCYGFYFTWCDILSFSTTDFVIFFYFSLSKLANKI